MLYAIGAYTSMGGPGIALVRAEQGRLTLVCSTAGNAEDPIWIEQHPTRNDLLYAACSEEKSESGRIASYRWNETGLELQSVQPTGGHACCHLAINKDGKYGYTANYVDGIVTSHEIMPDGRLKSVCNSVQLVGSGPNAERQERAHAHQIAFRPKSGQIFVCDLGSDRVMVYQPEKNGSLTLVEAVACPAGIGPRHLLFDGPDQVYLVGELGGWVAHYQHRENSWQLMQLLPTVPEGKSDGNTAAAIHMEGSRVYVSNRGHDSIVVFEKNAAGSLALEKWLPVHGQFPRDFVLTADGVLVACQNSGDLVLMDRDGILIDRMSIAGAVSILPLRE